jgi:TRAP-type C4-dicarboxylate transport system substrate-binding protein
MATMFPPQAIEGQAADEFAAKIAEDTNGLLTIRVYAGSTLISPPPELIDGVKAGVADMSFGLVYKPEGFEISADLPFELTASDSYSALEVYNKLWDEFPDVFAKEWEGVELLFSGCTVPQWFFFRDKKVESMADMKGLQIRLPSQELGAMVDRLGGTPVYISSSEMAVAVEKGTVQGITSQVPAILAFKMEKIKYCLKFKSGSMGVPTPNFMVMNQDTWNSLDPYYQKAFNDNREWGQKLISDKWTEAEVAALEYMKTTGAEFIYLSPEEEAKWLAIRDSVQDEAAAENDAMGLPGTEVLQFLRSTRYV